MFLKNKTKLLQKCLARKKKTMHELLHFYTNQNKPNFGFHFSSNFLKYPLIHFFFLSFKVRETEVEMGKVYALTAFPQGKI